MTAYLASRGIALPIGTTGHNPGAHSMHALSNLKDRHFQQQLVLHGVEPYKAAISLVRTLRALEIKTAVMSSSNNCMPELEVVGIAHLFDTVVDGTDVTRLQLAGKSAPDTLREAARRLGVTPMRAVVVEDAIGGVAAGHAGRFS